MRWPFSKFVGCGNDFILFDNRQGHFPITQPYLFTKLCHRQFGIGADGVILLEPAEKADFRMRIFNPDNTEAEMCGNGVRCFVKWLISIGLKKSLYSIETKHRLIQASAAETSVKVDMGVPKDEKWNLSLKFLDQQATVHFLNTGVPHAVVFVADVNAIDIQQWGFALRKHAMWQPNGTNVNFVQILSPNKIKVRTYERGVEGETLACGTGSTAAALAAAKQYNISSPIIVETQSKEELIIDFALENEGFSHVSMTGPAHFIFSGEVDLNSFN